MDAQRSQREWASSSPDPISASRLTPWPWFLRDFPVSFQLSAFFLVFLFVCFCSCIRFSIMYTQNTFHKGGDSQSLKAHLLSCLDFPFHATPRRRHGNHHRHFIAKEPQATGQPSRSPRKGGGLWPRPSVASTMPPWPWNHASLILKAPPEKGTLAPRHNQRRCAAFLSTVRHFLGVQELQLDH